jgi:hypothetical protein
MVATPASAQLGMMREHARQMDSGKLALGADLNSFFGHAQGAGYTFLQPTVLAAVRIQELVIEGAFPFAYFHENNDPGGDRDQFALGNLWFALGYLPDCSCGLSRLSLGVGAPTATDKNSGALTALSLARGATGDWDGYLWVPRLLPLVLGASTLKDFAHARLSWDGDLVVGLPGGDRDSEFGLQNAVEAALRFRWHTSLGARLSAAYYPTFDGDQFQSAAGLFLRHANPRGSSFGARFAVNLDGPHGPGFSREGMWGLGLFFARSL